MLFPIISLLIIGIVLFVISFFVNDRFKNIENQIEQISLSSLQDSYQMKKKLKVLEEELLPTQFDFSNQTGLKSSVEKHVEALYRQGYNIQQISQATQISEYDIEALIKQL
ncbi:hypothetical protein [Amphibacillus xylanus]|uniref:Resolvase HTH domain-containing protein n=1 Tax=Amphibacillus xylanus (strain ATCC 51415 / DSM 6626 / JCM 7361 / LMG 17667 / NBRC 15112 / Ep01) TaxID=698758 RepID=K0IXX8_AMPXN|nr:hypothetical protein [Amphibacillus xylanus]BAM47269.1 hypothetical protein AXY_11370 [Amphibacillus xylanus NBRC 15112]